MTAAGRTGSLSTIECFLPLNAFYGEKESFGEADLRIEESSSRFLAASVWDLTGDGRARAHRAVGRRYALRRTMQWIETRLGLLRFVLNVYLFREFSRIDI